MVHQIVLVCAKWKFYSKVITSAPDIYSQQLLTAKPFPACIVSLRSSSWELSYSRPTLNGYHWDEDICFLPE